MRTVPSRTRRTQDRAGNVSPPTTTTLRLPDWFLAQICRLHVAAEVTAIDFRLGRRQQRCRGPRCRSCEAACRARQNVGAPDTLATCLLVGCQSELRPPCRETTLLSRPSCWQNSTTRSDLPHYRQSSQSRLTWGNSTDEVVRWNTIFDPCW